MIVRSSVTGPPLDLALAAPTSSYVTPFAAAARAGFAAVLLVALVALMLSAYLTTRLTRPLVRLAGAASDVSRGELEQHVDVAGPREIETLAASFNAMTDSVRHAMSELARRSALAAVGDFSASLAHQVRNALTSIKVDLQRAEERLDDGSASQELVSRSLSAVMHLDSAVTGAFRIGRSGSITSAPLDLGPVLQTAALRTLPMFSVTDTTLEVAVPSTDALRVSGDPAALEELFVNLLTNAAQALDAGGSARLSAQCENGSVVVAVADKGRGIAADQIDKVLEPFYTTRIGGTGLGLPIARQLAVAHGGNLAIESNPGVGTTITVRLPRV
jgi:two-component system sensor histidine kinase AtoS